MTSGSQELQIACGPALGGYSAPVVARGLRPGTATTALGSGSGSCRRTCSQLGQKVASSTSYALAQRIFHDQRGTLAPRELRTPPPQISSASGARAHMSSVAASAWGSGQTTGPSSSSLRQRLERDVARAPHVALPRHQLHTHRRHSPTNTVRCLTLA